MRFDILRRSARSEILDHSSSGLAAATKGESVLMEDPATARGAVLLPVRGGLGREVTPSLLSSHRTKKDMTLSTMIDLGRLDPSVSSDEDTYPRDSVVAVVGVSLWAVCASLSRLWKLPAD